MPNTHDTSFVENFPIINKPRDAHGTNSSNIVTDASSSTSDIPMKNGDFRLCQSGTATLDATGATSGVMIQTTIPHGLSYIPIPIVTIFDSTNSNYVTLPWSNTLSASGGAVVFNTWFWCDSDATNLYINFLPSATTNYGTWTFRYYLFQQTAN